MLSTTARIAAAAAAGYVLGRKRNLKFTVLSTCLIAGKDLVDDAQALTAKMVARNPELEDLRTHLTDDLPAAARELASAAAATGIETAASGTESMTASLKDAKRAIS